MKSCFLALASFAIAIGTPAGAATTDIDWTGELPFHNSVLRLDFTVSETATVTIFTSSWVSSGSSGGFDPVLGIWTADGNLIREQDDGIVGSTSSNNVLYPHGAWDAYFSEVLNPGSYFVTVAAYDNLARSMFYADGFDLDQEAPIPFSQWFQPSNGLRSSHFAVHILGAAGSTNPGQGSDPDPNPDPIAIPEPGTVGLLGAGLLAMSAAAHRFRR